jgi:hypothetical protein
MLERFYFLYLGWRKKNIVTGNAFEGTELLQ